MLAILIVVLIAAGCGQTNGDSDEAAGDDEGGLFARPTTSVGEDRTESATTDSDDAALDDAGDPGQADAADAAVGPDSADDAAMFGDDAEDELSAATRSDSDDSSTVGSDAQAPVGQSGDRSYTSEQAGTNSAGTNGAEAEDGWADDTGSDDTGSDDTGSDDTVAGDTAAGHASAQGRDSENADGDAEGLFVQPEIEPIEPDEPPAERQRDNRFTNYGYRRFIDADDDPFSTFALDANTGSFTIARRWLSEGVLPPTEAVRVEEFVNWFDYDYDTPRRGLEISVDGGPSPFDDENVLVRVGVAAEAVADNERPPVALTFIVDTSGSMERDDRLGLVKESLRILVDELDDDDTVAIVIYSTDSGVVLEPTAVRHRDEIFDAIASLRSGGSTNLESGLREGYGLAASSFRSDGINRVVIASDGVANAGIVDQVELSRFIRGYANEGIQLVTVGYGMGNFNDTMMEQLADHGDGFYAYIDDADEAERLFEDDLTSTLVTAAIDAKIQVEFDPEVVAEYRLIGFENRGVRDRDFRNDQIDAGELGAGHQVTAMYELRLHRGIDLDSRGDLGEVFLRWEDPETGEVIEIDEDIDRRDIEVDWSDTADDFQLATVVTAFAEVLRDNPYADGVSLRNIVVEADRVAGRLHDDKADELVHLLRIAGNYRN